jgi:hypothetical protein
MTGERVSLIGLSIPSMAKDKLIKILQGILKTDIDLNFLVQLKENELETLVACIRDRIEHGREN